MSIGPPPIPTTESDEPAGLISVSISNTNLTGHADGSIVEMRAAVHRTNQAGLSQQGVTRGRNDSDQSDYKPDLRPCPRGCGPMEYCHGHTSPSPTPIPPLRSPVPNPPATTPSRGLASFSSIVKTPQRWHVNSSRRSAKTTKMLLKYHQPIPREKLLPKGWVYDEDAKAVKTEELANPSLYELTRPRLTHAQRQLNECRRRLQWATSTTGDLTTSPSPLPTTTGDLHQPASSKST